MGRRIVSALVLSLALARVATAQTPRVAVDPRAELLGIVFKLAGNPDFTQGHLPAYDADIERHFGLFKNHPAITAARAIKDAQGMTGDAVLTLAVNVSNPPLLQERQPFDARPGESRWRTAESSRLLTEVRRLALAARASAFLSAHRALYDTASTRLKRSLERSADFTWFAKFFGAPPDQDFTVVPLLAAPGVIFTPTTDVPMHRTERFVMVGTDGPDSTGFPTFGDGATDLVVHEYTHAFVNGLVDANAAQLERPATLLYQASSDALREQGFGGWVSLSFETMARAAVARYDVARLAVGRDSAAANAYLADQKAKGWLWVEDLSALLGQYEADRDSYPTLKSFMPRVVAFFDSLPARLPALRARYDSTRPKIARLSIAPGAMDVDAGLKEITITFDRPMKTGSFGISAVPGSRDKMIRITQQAFDSTSTTLHVSVTLEASHDYAFQLNHASGGGLVSADGVPLERTIIQFRTRPRDN